MLTLNEAMSVVLSVFPDAIVDERHGEIVILTGAHIVSPEEHYAPMPEVN